MSQEYVDTLLINCSRKSGVEARSGNNTENAIWTNTLQQAVKLDVGDKVEMQSVYINEVGAANSQTIEFSGKQKGGGNKGINTIPTYTETLKLQPYDVKTTTYDARYRLGKYRELKTTEITGQTIPLQDNVAPFIYGYYITNNEYPQYIQQPRYFLGDYTRGTIPNNASLALLWEGGEGFPGDGFNQQSVNENMYAFADWHKTLGFSLAQIIKQVVDNSRYTLFVKDKVFYDQGITNSQTQFPTKSHNGIFSEANYLRVRDRLDISVNRGFNTPSAIAQQVTERLTETKSPESFEILDGTGYNREITKIISSNTYKSIECVNFWQFDKVNYDEFIASTLPIGAGGTANSQNLTDYISSFAYIGVKRPEIFESGRKMANEIVPNCPQILKANGTARSQLLTDGDEGFQIVSAINLAAAAPQREDSFIQTNIPYTLDNLQKIREFLDTQALYPELWDSIRNGVDFSLASQVSEASNPGTLDGRFTPTPAESRFFHINKYNTTPGAAVAVMDGFGSDNFKLSNTDRPDFVNKSSGTVFFKYDDDTKDLFIQPQDYDSGELRLSLGFARATNILQHTSDGAGGFIASDYYVIELNTELMGIPRSLFGGNFTKNIIEEGRRIGFDFHSNAFSTCIISPYSGQSVVDIGTKYAIPTGTRIIVPETHTRLANLDILSGGGNTFTDIAPYFTQVYVGANNPELRYNSETNRFELVRLHTSNNVGNTAFSGNPADDINNKSESSFLSLTPPSVNADSGDTVYKLNPRPSQLGFSPSFKPYGSKAQQIYINTAYPEAPSNAAADTVNRQYIQNQNQNIKPFSVFDSHGGIYIESFGYNSDQWEDNLWDILGFSYDAVQAAPSASNVLINRINTDNRTLLYRPTTNAEIISTDSKAYYTNRFGANMYYTAPPYPYNTFEATASGDPKEWVANTPYNSYIPEVTIKTQSMSITATDIQKSVLKPYYAIRSSIIEGYTAIGGDPTGANLPLVAVVDKYSAQGDFFFGKGDLQFTITKPTVIADITTAITDPDGEISNCDESSAIVYKITKLKRTPENILEMIFKEAEKAQKKIKK